MATRLEHLGFDAIRIANNSTGLGNYGRFIVSALAQEVPTARLTLFIPGRTSLAEDFSKLHSNLELIAPNPSYGKFWNENVWRRYKLANAAASAGAQVFHGLASELPLYCDELKLPTVVTFHDLIYLRFPQYFKAWDRQLYDWRYRSAARRADRIVAVSRQTANDLQEFFDIDTSKIHVIPQGCDPSFYEEISHQTLSQVLNKYRLDVGYLLHVGTIEPRKNIEHCLDALGKLENRSVQLVLVGRPTRHWKTLARLAVQLGLQPRIKVLDQVPNADLPALYKGASIFLYPSQFEGFGIPVLEAMAVGTPVITSRRSSMPEVAAAGAKYLETDDPDEFAAVVDKLLSDTQGLARLSAEGKKQALAFTRKQIASKLVELYQDVI